MSKRETARGVKVAPSILSADFSRLGEEVFSLERSGADMIHIDVMDGHFVPNITMGPAIVESIRKWTKLPLDVHLMIENPSKFVEAFAKAGSDILTIHIETCPHPKKTIEKIRENGVIPGIVLNPPTPVEKLYPFVHLVNFFLVMTVNPGFGGQTFIHSCLPKIRKLREKIHSDNADIEVDGGINDQTAHLVVKAGATILVSGNYILNNVQRAKAIATLKKL